MSNMVDLKVISILFENFLQIAITKLGHNIELCEILKSLFFGDDDIEHLYNILMLTVLQQNKFPEDSPSLRELIEKIRDFFNCHIFACFFYHCLSYMAIGSSANYLLNRIILEVFGWKNLVSI